MIVIIVRVLVWVVMILTALSVRVFTVMLAVLTQPVLHQLLLVLLVVSIDKLIHVESEVVVDIVSIFLFPFIKG